MNTRAFGLGLAVGVTAAGAAATYVLLQRVPRQPLVQKQHKAQKYGLSGSTNLRFFNNFIISYDSRLRNPQWVLEYITADTSAGIGNRKNVEFVEDASIEERFRSRLSDYRGSGYDRGHMAPAANHKSSQEDMNSTFILSNISPQVGKGFNRDYWARFERFVKELTSTCSEVFIVTGPLYLPRKTEKGYVMNHRMIGEPPCLVAVPTHFYKVLLAESASSSPSDGVPEVALGAFVMPNAPIEPDTPLTAFAVPLEALECVSGLSFFPGYVSGELRLLHDKKAMGWQDWGRRQLLRSRPESMPLALLDSLAPKPAIPETPEAAIVIEELPIGVLDKQTVENRAAVVVEKKQPQTRRQARKKQISNPTEATEELTIASLQGAATEARASSSPEGLGHQAPAGAGQDLGLDIADEADQRPSQDDPAKSDVEGLGSTSDRPGAMQLKLEKEGASPRGIEGFGLLHVCDLVECKLPAPDWYLKRREPKT